MKKIILFVSFLFIMDSYSISLLRSAPKNKEISMKLEQFYQNKKILVTGGCGFIGSHLAQKLVELGAIVTIIDDLSTGSLKNIEPFKSKISLLRESIVNQEACNQAVKDNDIIFHLAAFISVPGSVKDPVSCHNVNVNGTFNLLEAAKKHHVSRFVFSSTSSVYGARETTCFESDTNLEPISPYGVTKLMGEFYCKQFSNLFGVPCVVLRYFNVYGPRQNPHSHYAAVVAKFQYQMERNEPLTVFGDGTQTRDFVHVDDVVEANLMVGMAPAQLVNGQIYNIGSGKSISVLELIENLKQQFPNYSAPLQFQPARDGDVKHTSMNPTKFNRFKNQLLEQ
jgi:UDP-glucose 4-epimerase